MKTIGNFLDKAPLRINANVHPECGPLVSIIQDSGSLRFQHSMRPDQARKMAAALIEASELVEALAFGEASELVEALAFGEVAV